MAEFQNLRFNLHCEGSSNDNNSKPPQSPPRALLTLCCSALRCELCSEHAGKYKWKPLTAFNNGIVLWHRPLLHTHWGSFQAST